MGQSIDGLGPFFKPQDSQPGSTVVNQSQRDIGGVAQVPAPVFVDLALIRMCRNELEAVNLCIDLSRMADEVICERLGIDKGHWSRIRKGRAHFPTSKRIELMYLAGNWAPIQYELMRTPVGEYFKNLGRQEVLEVQRRAYETPMDYRAA